MLGDGFEFGVRKKLWCLGKLEATFPLIEVCRSDCHVSQLAIALAPPSAKVEEVPAFQMLIADDASDKTPGHSDTMCHYV